MKAITFFFRTEQPILATSFEGDPNSDVSYSYIPGSMIRGALIGRYLKKYQYQNIDILNHENIRDLFFNGKTRYLNAYLSTEELNQTRSLPTPLSWFKDKGAELPAKSEIQIYDLAGMELVNLPKDLSAKRFSSSFCTVRGRYVKIYNIERRMNIHNQRDRRRGTATDETGEIFRYEAIDKEQIFQGVVLCDYTDTREIEELLNYNENFWIGGSQSAGYGHTIIDRNKIKIHDNWNEVGVKIDSRLKRKNLQITLLSDLIFQNNYGQYVVEPPTKLLAEALKLNEKQLEQLKLQKSYIGNTVVAGFNRKWGLPLPQIPVLAAGSIFVFDYLQLEMKQIYDLEFQGIGERRIDGFGRLAVNWLDLEKSATFEASKSFKDKGSIEIQKLEENSYSAKLAREMAQRLLRQKLDNALIEQVGNIQLKGKIKNNQLSRLIIVARQALHDNCNLDLLTNLLNNLPSHSRNQFEKAEVQIREWVKNPKRWLSGLNTVNIAGEFGTSSEEYEVLAKEYTLRLIIALAKKASKEND